MPDDKPWSAPARGLQMQDQSRKLKFARIKSNATKTIEEWAHEGRSSAKPEVSIGRKNGTQLSDNVTEERMLQARLMELSKERYKFIHQIQYEKKMFLDRQQRKSAALREKLKNVSSESTNSRLRSWSASKAAARVVPSANRGAPRSRGTSSQQKCHSRLGARETKKAPGVEEEQRRPQTVPPRLSEQQQHDMAATDRPIFSTEPPVNDNDDSMTTKFTGPGKGGLPRLITPVRAATTVKFVDDPEHGGESPCPSSSATSTRRPRRRKCSEKSAWSRAGQLRATSMSQSSGPTYDHRYKDLEGCLCENYELQADVQPIPDIIQKCEALRVRAKRPREAKPKIAHKAYQFLAQKGIDFSFTT